MLGKVEGKEAIKNPGKKYVKLFSHPLFLAPSCLSNTQEMLDMFRITDQKQINQQQPNVIYFFCPHFCLTQFIASLNTAS